jgi:hypothetical protein
LINSVPNCIPLPALPALGAAEMQESKAHFISEAAAISKELVHDGFGPDTWKIRYYGAIV